MKNKNLKHLLLVGCILTGCSTAGTGDIERPAVVEVEAVAEYSVEQAKLSNIQSKSNLYFQYKQSDIVEYSFADGGVLEGIYFKEGDHVAKGDLLASFMGYKSGQASLSGYEDELEAKKEKYEAMKRELDFGLEELEIKHRYGVTSDDIYQAGAQELHDKYDSDLGYLEDEIAILELRIEMATKDAAAGAIFAESSGTFAWGKDCYNIADSSDWDSFDADWQRRIKRFNTVKAGDTVVKVAGGEAVFYCETEYANLFEPGQIVNLTSGDNTFQTVVETAADGVVTLVPKTVSEKMYVGMQINYELITETKNSVVTISKTSLHSAGDKSYVYTVGEDGLRRIQYVETGISSNSEVEIVSGLNAGDVIVKR